MNCKMNISLGPRKNWPTTYKAVLFMCPAATNEAKQAQKVFGYLHFQNKCVRGWLVKNLLQSHKNLRARGLRHLKVGGWRGLVPVILLFPLTNYLTPHCLSPPRCINGYRLQTDGGNPAMD